MLSVLTEIKNTKLKREIIILQKEILSFSLGSYYAPPRLDLIDVEKGKIEIIECMNNKILLHIFTDSCSSCNEINLSLMKRLSSELRDKIPVLMVAMTSKDTWLQGMGRPVSISKLYVPLDASRFVKEFRVSTTPLTLFIDEGCRIKFIKKGDLSRDDYLEIKKIINMEV